MTQTTVLMHQSVAGQPMIGRAIEIFPVYLFGLAPVRLFVVDGVRYFELSEPGLYMVADFDGAVLLADADARTRFEQFTFAVGPQSIAYLRVREDGTAEQLSEIDFRTEFSAELSRVREVMPLAQGVSSNA